MRLRGLWLIELNGLPAPFLWRTDGEYAGSEAPNAWGYEEETADWASEPEPMFGGMSTAFLSSDVGNEVGHDGGEGALADDDATPEPSEDEESDSQDEEEVMASGSEDDDDDDATEDTKAARQARSTVQPSETSLLFDDASLLSRGLASLAVKPS